MRVQIVIVSPPGNPHAAAFSEVAETVMHAFNALGHQARIVVNGFSTDALNVVFGIHALPKKSVQQLPSETVVYNLEQIEDGLFEWAGCLREALSRFEIWDYSLRNIEELKRRRLAPRLFHLPIGTMPEMTRIETAPNQDIDVLFYGTVNERRRVILKALADSGLAVKAMFGCYGVERDQLIGRSKLVLNLHKHDAQVFEIVRVSYLLANRKAVVAEVSPTTAIEKDLVDAICGAPYEALVNECRRLVTDDVARRDLECRGYQAMMARREDDFLRTVLDRRTGTASRSK